MATKQSLKGGTSKIYEIVNTFNRGYNTSVADDQLNENVFRDIVNFLPSTEGNISKRPGIKRMKMYEFFEGLLDPTTLEDEENTILEISGYVNTSNTQLTSVDLLYQQLFKLLPVTGIRNDEYLSNIYTRFEPKSLANFTIMNEDNLTKYIDNLDILLHYDASDEFYGESMDSIDFVAILYGDYTEKPNNNYTILNTNAISIFKVRIGLYRDANEKHHIRIRFNIINPYRNDHGSRLNFRYTADETIDFAIYADKYYFMNGYDAIVEIDRGIGYTITQTGGVVEYHKESLDLYKPTAIEVTNIGFNILAQNPLDYVSNVGVANTIRGVFYTYAGQPTQIIPYDKNFIIHILANGTGVIDTPKYRPNNGEVDEELNPYKTMPGQFNADQTQFACIGGLHEGYSEIEIKLTKGGTDFISYVKMGTVEENELNNISAISNLILSSRYCKVINNQLVLYGNHGYLFFSEFDNFKYFPNYNNIYIAQTENEYAVSINYFRQYYAIFTNKRIKRMTGAFGADNFGIYPLNDFIGCINPKTIKQVQNQLYFLSYNGLYMLKQGYLGEGTENVEQVDLPIYKSYNPETMIKGYTLQNYYILASKNESLLYNFTNEAFYKLRITDATAEETSLYNVKETSYSIPFQYNKLQNKLFYGIKETEEVEAATYEDKFDFCSQDFTEEETERKDNELTFVSTVETPMMSLGTPTNTKKFKEIYLKLYNSYGKNIPLYVTIKVDDKVVVSPHNYVIKYDEQTSTYYYVEESESNKELKGYNVLGTMELGEDPLGERTMQILKMRVGSKGRGIKIILSDGIVQGEQGYSPNQNMYRFDLATIGVVYKLKKVKEG